MPASEILAKFEARTLHSGSPDGPIVTNPHQAKAIQMSYARKEGANIKPPASGGHKNSSDGKRHWSGH